MFFFINKQQHIYKIYFKKFKKEAAPKKEAGGDAKHV